MYIVKLVREKNQQFKNHKMWQLNIEIASNTQKPSCWQNKQCVKSTFVQALYNLQLNV